MKGRTVFSMALPIALVCFAGFLFVFTGYGASSQEIKDSEQTISQNQQKIKELQDTQSTLKNEMNQLNSLKQDAAAYISQLDAQQLALKEQIAALSTEIAETEDRIEKTKQELAQTGEELQEQKKSMALRIRFIYEADKGGVLETLFQSENLADLLNNVEYIQQISKADRQKLESFTALYDKVQAQETALEAEAELLEAQQASLQEDLLSAEALSQNKAEEIAVYEKQISDASKKVSELSRDVSGLQEAIKAEENKIAAIEAELKRKEEEARKKAEEAKKEYKIRSLGELSFLWPVPASSRVTSYFGDREAPVDGASTNHKGIDIGAEEGSPVKAAESGTVVIATYSGSAGNYVMISHGGGVYTVYMHLSEIYVSEDQEVSRGETIGAVGSTGYSTGPHLHFGVRVDGSYVDPLAYVAP